jgi:glyoxylase-like metal-dependent hydrolase (beta-lactamase superfamily II)
MFGEAKSLSAKIQSVAGNSFFARVGDSNVGIVKNPLTDVVVLIDSGRNAAEASTLCQVLKNKNLSIAAIINTHGHADHFGGNAYLKSAYPDLQVFATSKEREFIENPQSALERLCQGNPPAEMRIGDFLVESSHVTDEILLSEHDEEIAGILLHIVPLPGHTPGMIGVKTLDGAFYVGDGILAQSLLRKYGVPYFTDIAATYESLDRLKREAVSTVFFVLAHGGKLASPKIAPLVDEHIDRLRHIEQFIVSVVPEDRIALDALLRRLMAEFCVADTASQRALTGATLMAFVTFLEQKKIDR